MGGRSGEGSEKSSQKEKHSTSCPRGVASYSNTQVRVDWDELDPQLCVSCVSVSPIVQAKQVGGSIRGFAKVCFLQKGALKYLKKTSHAAQDNTVVDGDSSCKPRWLL